jgi:hypothetical protein
MCTNVCVCIRLYACMYVHECICAHSWAQQDGRPHARVCRHVCRHACMYVSVWDKDDIVSITLITVIFHVLLQQIRNTIYICIHIYICIYIYTYIHIE